MRRKLDLDVEMYVDEVKVRVRLGEAAILATD